MNKNNLEKLKDVYRVWLNEPECWNKHVSSHLVDGHEVEELDSVTVLPSTTAAYIGETIRQVIESEEAGLLEKQVDGRSI